MTNEQKQELIELFNKTPYMPYFEVLALLKSCIPDRAKLLERMLVEDLRHFELNVYFWSEYSHGEEIFLPEPVAATEKSVEYHVSQPDRYCAYFWQFGELSTRELTEWLQNKGIASSFFEATTNQIPDYLKDSLPEHSYKLAAAVKAWEHFYNRRDDIRGKSLKSHVKAWLAANAEALNLFKKKRGGKGAPELNETAIEEIAKIVNWKTEGGAPES